jgi:hypothetical protein
MAWECLRKDRGDRDLPDIICLEDVSSEWPSFRDSLVSIVAAGRYSLSHSEVRRALLIALYDSGECPYSLLDSLARSSNQLGITARYLQGSPKRIPCPDMEVAR